MKILAVDDERLALESLEKTLKRVEATAEIVSISDAEEALSYLAENKVDIVFLDIEMGELSGIDIAKRCKELIPTINIIFVTGHSKYMTDAFKLHASGYLMKPIREKDVRMEIDNLRYPLSHAATQRVRIQTFGNFEVFVDGKPLDLPRAKSKECLAYLVDRKGAMISVAELAAVLYEDMAYDSTAQNNVHQIIFTLIKALNGAGIGDIIIKNRREIGINTERVDCDYYAAINGNMALMNAFSGEYMTNYSWAELTLGGLIAQKSIKK